MGPREDDGRGGPGGEDRLRAGPGAVLLLAAWIGLIAGFLDLGLLIVVRWLAGDAFYRMGEGFPWIVPAGVAAVVALPAVVLAPIARRRRGGIPFGLAAGVPAFVGFLDLCSTFPLSLWAAVLLAAGLAVQSARLLSSRRRASLRLVRITTPLLVGVVLALAAATSGARAWSERRALAAPPPPPPNAPPNVLLIVWDTVRAGSLSLHGYGRRTTPHLERLAARGVRFEHAFSTSPWTLPSHASFFTGRWAHELSAGWKTPLDGAEPTLAERLGALGYDTAGFVANLDYCGREGGLARGFVHYEDFPLGPWEVFTRYVGLGRKLDLVTLAMAAELVAGGARGRGEIRPRLPLSKEHAKRAEDIDRGFLDWLSRRRPRGRPFFAFLNFNDAHTPYEAPRDSGPAFGLRPTSWNDLIVMQQWNMLDKRKRPLREVQLANDLYDDSIAHLDRRLGALLDELSRRGVLEDTVVVVTSDHGEHLGDHGLFFHGGSLYRPSVEVPLVIVDPRRVPAGRSVAHPVSLRDLPATILDLVGAGGGPFPGRSLARLWAPGAGEDVPAIDPLLMETDRPPLLANQGREPAAKGPMKGMIAGGMHYIRSGDGGEELYALEVDPDERMNVAGLPEAEESLRGFRGALRSMLRTRRTREARAARPAGDLSRRE